MSRYSNLLSLLPHDVMTLCAIYDDWSVFTIPCISQKHEEYTQNHEEYIRLLIITHFSCLVVLYCFCCCVELLWKQRKSIIILSGSMYTTLSMLCWVLMMLVQEVDCPRMTSSWPTQWISLFRWTESNDVYFCSRVLEIECCNRWSRIISLLKGQVVEQLSQSQLV
jgi:hypothetical protein